MNRSKKSKIRAGGFTLMELLVVVSIMIILAGLTMGVLSYVNQKQAVEKAKVQLGLLELALEDYYSENGEYPRGRNREGRSMTRYIVQELFPNSTKKKIYLVELDDKNDTQNWREGDTIVDPWGTEYRYRANAGNSVYAANPGFDIWSCGPDGITEAGSNGEYDPEAAANLDDVRLW